jgi:hypothetical protein
VQADVFNFVLEVPLELRLMLGREGRGLYVLGGATPQLPLFHLKNAHAARTDDLHASIDEGDYEGRMTTMITTGLGYQLRATDKFDVYVQAVFRWSTGTINEDLGTGTSGSLNYLQPARIQQIGLSFGVSF